MHFRPFETYNMANTNGFTFDWIELFLILQVTYSLLKNYLLSLKPCWSLICMYSSHNTPGSLNPFLHPKLCWFCRVALENQTDNQSSHSWSNSWCSSYCAYELQRLSGTVQVVCLGQVVLLRCICLQNHTQSDDHKHPVQVLDRVRTNLKCTKNWKFSRKSFGQVSKGLKSIFERTWSWVKAENRSKMLSKKGKNSERWETLQTHCRKTNKY